VWMLPLIEVVIYPGLILSVGWAINGDHRCGDAFLAFYALLTMFLALSILVLAARALILMRHAERPVPARSIIYLFLSYFFSLCMWLVAAGVLLHHGVAKTVGNRALYGNPRANRIAYSFWQKLRKRAQRFLWEAI
jgi:hypothetical protein